MAEKLEKPDRLNTVEVDVLDLSVIEKQLLVLKRGIEGAIGRVKRLKQLN